MEIASKTKKKNFLISEIEVLLSEIQLTLNYCIIVLFEAYLN